VPPRASKDVALYVVPGEQFFYEIYMRKKGRGRLCRSNNDGIIGLLTRRDRTNLDIATRD
jgi:hypothetical protein